ncbi:hypothetical protein V6M85_03085 [Sulfolobus tengchongensis]|uniref:Uncharacterized protein n=1 Tax=Sulfolobus tengchongensis TaxID=207809 RepID=A0AAX4L4G0_9CREN
MGIFTPEVEATIDYVLKLNKKVEFQYKPLVKDMKNLCSISNILGSLKKIRSDMEVTRSLEDDVRELLGAEKAENKCIEDICGRADFMKDNIPGEIKTVNQESPNKFEVIDKGKKQAGMYSWLYNTRFAYLAIAEYKIDEEKGETLLTKLTLYKVVLKSRINIEELKEICIKIKESKAIIDKEVLS